jgi:hypothetical protein
MADGVKIVTNNHRREVIDAWQLTEAERAEFDYLDWEALERGEDSASFVRYKGELIDLGENEMGYGSPTPDWLAGWHGYRSDSFFSGIVWRYPIDDLEPVNRIDGDPNFDWESVIIGTYYAS